MKRQNGNSRSRMTREALRRKRSPFYKKKSFIIPLILVIIIVIGIFTFWKINSSNNTNSTQPSHKVEKVTSKKSTKKKTTKKAKKNEPKKVTKDQPAQKVEKQPEQKQTAPQIKNPGTYDNLTYDTDWYTFKISNEVKLIKDANGDAALMVKYNYTNKTNNNEVPQQVQNNAIMLKQDGKQLSATTATGDNAAIINSSNNGQVQPGKSFDGALLVKVNSTTSEVTMYFKNIQTNAWLDSTQPLKLD
ncbi:DUF5067 domain-containing protein [Companilactobacillus muriivasis]|uniref:DUF5067 domain-containing protein n=1 Tax=Companilactobacillus muriivasis TaxID=3081444 RepID=UPI0030C70FC9